MELHANLPGFSPTRCARICRRWFSLPKLIVALLAAVARADAANIIHEFYVPLPEAQVKTALVSIEPAAGVVGSTIESVISIVVTGAGTVVHYDEWEDGYEIDLNKPTQSTTKIWGDGNNANGVPPGYANDPVSFTPGSVIILRNLVPLPRNPANFLYDGRDRFGGTKALVVSRASWATTPGTVLAGANEVLATMDYGTNYIAPVGDDVSAASMFEWVGLAVMARDDATSVSIDADGPGAGAAITVTLNRGESYLVNGGIKKGATVVASKPVQVDLITGDIGARYESRRFTLYPRDQWSNTTYSPVGTAANSDASFAFIYNPNPGSITVNATTCLGTTPLTVPANGVVQWQLAKSCGAKFATAGGEDFFGIVCVGANPTANNVHDWGFSMVPSDNLTSQAVVGWGPGSSDGTQNGSPVWVTPTKATRVYVDLNGDGVGSLTDPLGGKYDAHYDIGALETRTVYDPDKDGTAMKLYTLDGTTIAVAWGQDPAVAGPALPYLDCGTTVLPFPVPVLKKTAMLFTDTAPTGLSIGDTIEYTVTVDNKGLLPLGNLIVLDPLNASLSYVAGSTTRDTVAIPDGVSGTPFPLDESGYNIPIILRGGSTILKYRATITAAGTITNTVNNITYNLNSDATLTVPPGGGSTPCTVAFTNSSGTVQASYTAGTSVYATVTDPDSNQSSTTIETMMAVVTNAATGDAETITLTETGVNTGIFRNLTGLPTSTSTGSSTSDGTLYVVAGNTITVSHLDTLFGETCTSTATITLAAQTKILYLNDTLALDRVDPAAVPVDNTVANTAVLTTGTAGTITQDASSTNSSAGTTSLAIPHTTGSSANRLMIVTVALGNSGGGVPTVSGITYNGQALSLVQGQTNGTTVRAEMWKLVNPPSGAATVTISTSLTAPVAANVITYSGVDQTTPLGTPVAGGSGKGNSLSLTVASSSGDVVVDSFAVDGDTSNTAPTPTAGSGQNVLMNLKPSIYLDGASSWKSGPAGTMSWSWTGPKQQPAGIAVAIKAAISAANLTATFVHAPTFASTFTIPAASTPSVTAYYTVSSGSMPASPSITAVLKNGATTLATSSSTTASAATGSGLFTFNFAALGSAINFASTEALTLDITTAQSGVTFAVDYDASTKASKITLPTTTVITVGTPGVYDAPYPGGALITAPISGSTVYVRASGTDPFGAYDITSMGLTIDGPGTAGDVSTTLTAPNVVNTTTGGKTYEYVWNVGATTGTYNISVQANEGTEGINARSATTVGVTQLDLGTPSTTEFTTGLGGAGTPTYIGGEQVCVRITDIDQNTNASAIETITAVITATSGDSELITLTETGINTGVFTFCIPASISGGVGNNNGTLHAILGDVLHVVYVDPTDSTDTSDDTAAIPNTAPAVSVAKSLVSPSDGVCVIGDPVSFTLQITNTGNTTLNSVGAVDTYNNTKLTYVSASLTPNVISSNHVDWTNVGPLAPGQSVTITVNFTAIAADAPTTNSIAITATGGVTANHTANVTINNPRITLAKTRLSSSPANIGSNVVFRIVATNDGTSAIASLPIEDTFSGANFEFVSATVPPDASGNGSLLWLDVTGAGNLAPAGVITIDVTLKVKGAAAPATNLAAANYTTDVNGDSAPPVSSSATCTLIAATISGHVYDDNVVTNGIFDTGEPGLEGITVSLYTDPNGDGNPADGVLVATTPTDANGVFDFPNLALGNYVIVESQPSGYASSGDYSAPNDNRIPVVIGTLTTFPGRDFFDFLTPPVSYASIAGKVWNDANASATVNGGEVGIANVAVDLVEDTNNNGIADSGEPVVNSTLTAADGTYSFGFLSAGNYVVVEHDLFNWYSTADSAAPNNNMIPVVLTSGLNVTGKDFLDVLTGSTGGKVFRDANGNGAFDAGDVALANIDVLITDSRGVTQTVVTDASGNWTATLPPGLTTIDVQQADPQFTAVFTSGFTQTAGTDSSTVTVVSGVNTSAGDDGFRQVGTITGHLYVDTNGNGTQDIGEPNLANVDVIITKVDLTTMTVTTDASGNWTASVPPGLTTVDIDNTDPQFTALVLAGSVQTQGTDPSTVTAVANASTNAGTDGFFNPGVISGVVSKDTNNDDIADATLSGVPMKLFTDPNGDGDPADGVQYGASQNTNGSGAYSFTGLPPGSYVVVMTTPSGYAAIIDGDTTAPGDDVANASLTDARIPVTVIGGETDNGNHFLTEQYGTISGTVLTDINNDDTGDDPVANVTLTLVDSAGNLVDGDLVTPGVQLITTTTDINGDYTFANVPPGTYGVKETQPGGYLNVTDTDGGNPNEVRPLVVTAGGTLAASFIEEAIATINGTVLADTDNDDVGDTGISGVVLTLLDGSGAVIDGDPLTGGVQPITATTNGSGAYSFTNLVPGTYRISQAQPSGYASLEDRDGGDLDVIGDVVARVLDAGETDSNNNFVEEQYGSITGTVMKDTDNNNSGDAAFPGVVLTLLDLSGAVIDGDPLTAGVQPVTATTNGSGVYTFSNVPPGQYRVGEAQPSGYQSVSDADGGNLDQIGDVTLIDVSPGGTAADRNFVEEQLGTISGTVVVGATPLQNVVLALFTDPNGDGDPSDGAQLGGTVLSNGSGVYTFTDVEPGTYVVVQTQPGGYVSVGDGDTTIPNDDLANASQTDNRIPVSITAGETDDGNTFTEGCPTITVNPATLANGVVGSSYNQTLSATGGTAAYSYSVATGSLPAGLSLTGATISGTPTSSTAATFTITATDSLGCTGTRSYTITPVCPSITVNPASLPGATVGTSYSQTLSASGGTAAYTFAVTTGSLPNGLTLSGATISGTSTAAGTANFTITGTDVNGCTGTRALSITSTCPTITVNPASLPDATVGSSYSQTLSATGGTAAYTFAVTTGSLPAGLALTGDTISGTSTTAGTVNFTITGTDANGCTGTRALAITSTCPTITVSPSSLPAAVVGTSYSQQLSASGGTSAYTYAVTTGSLPAGLTLTGDTIIGTPTSTSSQTFTITATDANSCTGARTFTLAPTCPTISLSSTPAVLPSGTVGASYSGTINATGGTAAYTFAVKVGSALPPGLVISSAGAISGTPTTNGTANTIIVATDANGCNGEATFTINIGCNTLAVAPSSVGDGVVGTAYTPVVFTQTGGTGVITWSQSGTLPAGMSFNTGTQTLGGAPTEAGNWTITITATDANTCAGSVNLTFSTSCPTITVTPASLAAAVVGTSYSATLTGNGGAAPYTFAVTTGILPAGLSLSGDTITGTPTSTASQTFIITATDDNGCTGTRSFTLAPTCPTIIVNPASLPNGVVGTAYNQTLSGSDGTAPYSFAVTSGALPAGLSLSGTDISGTPTATTSATFTITATDDFGCTGTRSFTLTPVCPTIAVSPSTLPDGVVGTSYNQTLTGSGGTSPYTFAVTTGSLPNGLSLASGVISGTPTETTSETFIITATDAHGCTGTRSFTLTPACPTITVNPATLPDASVGSAYSATLSATGGTAPYSFAVTNGALPAGLVLIGDAITGTATAAESTSFTITVTDDNGCEGTRTLTLDAVCPTVTVSPASLPDGTVGTAYSQTLSGSGGTGPYTFAVTSGTLPAGLTLTGATITGTPTSTVSAAFTITATDMHDCEGTRSFTLMPACPTIMVSPVTLPDAVLGVPYSETLSASGGTAAYSFAVTTGVLPAGLTLVGDTISGTPTSTAGETFTITATDANGCEGTRSLTINGVGAIVMGHLYFDRNGNGTQDGAEPDLADVTVIVTDSANVQHAVLTDGNGDWSLAVAPGTTSVDVEEADPDFLAVIDHAFTLTEGTSPTVVIAVAGQSEDAGNDGYFMPASLTGFVLADTDNDDIGDMGISGVVLTLLDVDEMVIDGDPNTIGVQPITVTTDSDGFYAFTNLPPGIYEIAQAQPAGYASLGDRDGNDLDIIGDSVARVLDPGDVDEDNTFVEEQYGSISGYVFADTDNDDNGDSGLANVVLTLLDLSGAVIDGDPGSNGVQPITATTDGTGFYIFNDVPPGEYRIGEAQPSGYQSVSDADGGNLDQIGDTVLVNVSAGVENEDNNFVEEQLGSISGSVFADADNDNVGDTPMENVALALFSDPNGDGDPSDGVQIGGQVLTDVDGGYSFGSIAPGSYVLVQTQPPGYLTAIDGDTTTAGDDAVNASTTDNRIPVTITAGETDDGNNFVEELPATVSGHLYLDTNGNGTQNSGEPNLANVDVLITDSAGGTQTVSTNGAGDWSASVAPGSTSANVQEGDPQFPTGSTQTQGTDPTTVIAAAGGSSDAGIDGYFIEATVTGHLYRDTNGNGVQGVGEPHLANVDVVITDANGVMQTVTTNASGNWTATVPPGSTTANVDESDPQYPAGAAQTQGNDPTTFTAVAGTSTSGGIDGYFVFGTAVGHLYLDTNGDGDQDIGEPDLAGVDLIITDVLGRSLPVTTDANGNWTIDVPPGSTTANVQEFDPQYPAGSTQTQGTEPTTFNVVANVTIDGGTDGYFVPATVTGHLYVDANGDGDQDIGEPDLAGVDVVITASDTSTQTVTTNSSGNWSATVVPGSTSANVDESDPQYPAGATQTQGNDPTTFAAVAGSSTSGGIDGYFIPGTIRGVVFDDTNRDYIGDLPIPNVALALFSDPNADGDPSDGVQIGGSVQTSLLGIYAFTNMPPGSYVVVETQPAGYYNAVERDTTDPDDDVDNDWNDNRIPVTITPGETDDGNAFIEHRPGEIRGRVSADQNNDDVGDVGISGVMITLVGDNPNLPGYQIYTVTTDADGYYAFTNLQSNLGGYAVIETQPSGYFSVTPDSFLSVWFAPGGVATADFVEEQPGQIMGRVLADTNNDNAGDTPISGVTLTLLDANGNVMDGDSNAFGVQPIVAGTGNDGFYYFVPVSPGNYRVKETQPALYYSVSDTDGGDLDVIGDQTLIVVGAGGSSSGNNFVEEQTGTIGNLVWVDANNNGRKDGGESGLDGVVVELLDAGGNAIDSDLNTAGVQPTTSTTSGGGLYSFGGIPTGSYKMRIATPPAAYPMSSIATSTADDQVDNDDNGAQSMPTAPVTSPVIALTSGETDNTVDFGFTAVNGLRSISGQVRDDYDSDGNFSDNDGPVAGVTVKLYADSNGNGVFDPGTDALIATTTTDGFGAYLFAALPDGTYFVQEEDPRASTSTADTQGLLNDNLVKVVISGASSSGNDFLDAVDPLGYFFDVETGEIVQGGSISVTGPGVATLLMDGSGGQYSFITDGTPGIYVMSITPPPGYTRDPSRVEIPGTFDPTGGPNPTIMGSSEDPLNPGSLVDFSAAANPYYLCFTLTPGDPMVINNNIPVLRNKPITFGGWQSRNPLGGQNGTTQNPDGDRFNNLQEYAFCYAANTGVSIGCPLRIIVNANGRIDAQVRRASALSDVIYTLEFIADLASSGANGAGWTPVTTILPAILNNGDGTDTLTYQDLATLPGLIPGKGFVRIRVDLDTNGDTVPEQTTRTLVSGWDTRSLAVQCQTCSMPFFPCDIFSGVVDSVGGALNVATSVGAGSVSGAFVNGRQYYIEVLSGDNAGHRFDVNKAASTATTIAISTAPGNQNTLAFVPANLAGDVIAVRQHLTLDDLFVKSKFTATNNQTTADRLLFFNAATGVFDEIYWLFFNGGAPKWVLSTDAMLNDRGTRAVDPAGALYVHCRTSAVSLTFSGHVRENSFACPLKPGSNLIGSGFPMDQSPALRQMSAANGFTGGRDPRLSDQIRFWAGDTSTGTEAYISHFLLEYQTYHQWSPQANASLPNENNLMLFKSLHGAFIKSINGKSNWVLPAPWTP